MKLIKTMLGKIKLTKQTWTEIGRKTGWLLKAQNDQIEIEEIEPITPMSTPKPMGWDPFAAREEVEEGKEKPQEELWDPIHATLERKDTKYGNLIFVILRNTSSEISNELKEMGYKAFRNKITGEWTWSKIVNKYKSPDLDEQKLEQVKSELTGKGVDVSSLESGPIDVEPDQEHTITTPDIEIPEEMVYWHNEMEEAAKLSPSERKKKYTDIIRNALEKVGEQVELDATSEQSQAIIKTLLTASSKFHNYSFWNSLMVAISKPGAEYVASEASWKIMGRVSKKGAKRIPIMFPRQGRKLNSEDKQNMTSAEVAWAERTRFGMGTALAYEDTEPIPNWVSKRGKFKGQGPFEAPEWQINSNEVTVWLMKLYEAAYQWATQTKKFNISTESMDITGGWASIGGRIAINDKSDGIRKVSTLFHEIAHQLIHFDPEFSRSSSTKSERETDAEATAYVVCAHYHIENKDTPIYLAGFGANKNAILGRFNYIQKAAIEMFEGIDQMMASMEESKPVETDLAVSTENQMEPNEMPTPDRAPEQTPVTASNILVFLKSNCIDEKFI